MPIHEYRCLDCRKKVSVFYRSLGSVDHASVVCDRCGGRRVTRLVSRVRVVRSAGDGNGGNELGPQGDVDESLMNEMSGLDESDPKSLGRFMRKMAAETGEDLGPEFHEVIGRLEKGEDPERIEQDMGDLFGDAAAGGMDDEMGGPPESPTERADKAEEKRDKAKTARRKTSAGKKPAVKAKPAKAKRRGA